MSAHATLRSLVFAVGFTAVLPACSEDTGSEDISAGGSSASDPDGNTDPNADRAFPADTSAAGIATFLESGSYESDPWRGEALPPREVDKRSTGSPHSRVVVYWNRTLLDSFAAGNGTDISAPGHEPGSGVVKELYDSSDQLVGKAAMFRTGQDDAARTGWTYYCYGPPGECATGSAETTANDPIYGEDITECSSCHGGLAFTLIDGRHL